MGPRHVLDDLTVRAGERYIERSLMAARGTAVDMDGARKVAEMEMIVRLRIKPDGELGGLLLRT